MSYQELKAARDERINARKHEIVFNSRFGHLNIHNGFRPGELHTFIAEKGGGKSTLIRAWAFEALSQKKRVYIRLSEEYSQDYIDDIGQFFNEQTHVYLENLIVDSELELSKDELGKGYVEALDLNVKKHGAHLFILDNFTTSALSRETPKVQEESAVAMRKMAGRNQIPVIVAAHTEKGFKKTTIATGDNIRGNMTLANTAAYIYTLTIFHDRPKRPAILFIDKARNHGTANKRIFLLEYNTDHGNYVGDKPIDHKIMAELMKPETP